PRVAQPAASALCDEHTLSGFSQIRQQRERLSRIRGLLVHERPDRNGQFEIGAVVSCAVGALSVLAAFRAELGMEAEVDQRVGMRAGNDEAGAAGPAAAAARPSTRHELLATERKASAPAVACFDVNIDFVYKHRVIWRPGDLVIAIGSLPITRSRSHQI